MSAGVQSGTAILLAKAERAAHSAAAALDRGAPDLAAGRAFAAIVGAAKAVLSERGLRPRSHDRLVEALARVRGDEMASLAQWLGEVLARRRSGDTAELTHEDAAALCARAEQALSIARHALSICAGS